MKALLCIDDTDNLESIGTGELLENICDELESAGLASTGFVTRHQLFIHEDIEYTSHNSSMCCEIETGDLKTVTELSRKYLAEHSAEGSDPGICIYDLKDERAREDLMSFGKRAKVEVLKKEEAYALAEKYPGILFLSEHGGTGIGVIGALAGVGLRLTGNDGRIKGKIKPERKGDVLTVKEFCERYVAKQVLTEEGLRLNDEETICFLYPTKAVMQDGKPSLVVIKENGDWVPRPHKKGRK